MIRIATEYSHVYALNNLFILSSMFIDYKYMLMIIIIIIGRWGQSHCLYDYILRRIAKKNIR